MAEEGLEVWGDKGRSEKSSGKRDVQSGHLAASGHSLKARVSVSGFFKTPQLGSYRHIGGQELNYPWAEWKGAK